MPDAAATLAGSAGEIPALLAAVGALTADPMALREWLIGFDDLDQAATVAGHSYWHQNGFAKLVLHRTDQFRIRMHVWPAGENRLGETNPHGHRWNFASTVLCGDGLSTEEYVEADEGVSHIRYCYLGALSRMAPVGRACLRTIESRVVRAGQCHSVDTSVIHTVEPVGTDLVATLVVQTAALVESAPVYGVPGKVVDEPIVAITPGQVRSLISDVRDAVDAQAVRRRP